SIPLISDYYPPFCHLAPSPHVTYTLSLHDALPIFAHYFASVGRRIVDVEVVEFAGRAIAAKLLRLRLPLRLAAPQQVLEDGVVRSEEHTSELQSRENLVCRLLLEKKK